MRFGFMQCWKLPQWICISCKPPPPPRGELAASPRDWHFTLRVHVPQLELELLLAEVPAAGLSKLQAASYRKLLLCLCATKRS